MVEKYFLRCFPFMNILCGSPCIFDIECVFVISIVGFSNITFWGLLPLEVSMVTPFYIQPSSTVGCFSFTSTRLFSISFDLKKVGKVRELVEQFKEIRIVPMRIIPESVSLSKLQIDLVSSIALLPIWFSLDYIGIASSFNFFDSLVFFSSAYLGTSLSCLFSIAICHCILLF